jgi:hypothetical protein
MIRPRLRARVLVSARLADSYLDIFCDLCVLPPSPSLRARQVLRLFLFPIRHRTSFPIVSDFCAFLQLPPIPLRSLRSFAAILSWASHQAIPIFSLNKASLMATARSLRTCAQS